MEHPSIAVLEGLCDGPTGFARVDELLACHARARGQHAAIQVGQVSVTYGDVLDRAQRLAAQLRAGGLGSGDRIALLAKNDVAFCDLMMAASLTGIVLVPINFRLARPEIEFIVRDAGVRLLFAGADFAETARAVQANCGTDVAVVDVSADGAYGGWLSTSERQKGATGGRDAILFQMYTSGTTGHPKGALISQGNVLAIVKNGIQFLGPFDEMSRSLVCMPLFHVAGNAWLFFGLGAGCFNSLVVDIDPEDLLTRISEDGITCTLMVPAVIRMLVLAAEAREQTVRGLKTIVFGASPMPAELLKRAQKVFPETDFIHVYGMTETTCMFCALDPQELRAGRRLESCGKPFPDAAMKIVDEAGAELPTGRIGEIVCATPQMMSGYWQRPEATAKAIRDGWYHTGDAGFVDAEGFLHIRDRIKDMLISGGENVYPAEVENAILAHPAVADVAVIGVPDERWGEVGLAAVVLKAGARAEDDAIKATVRERLAGYKVPKRVVYLEALPRNGAGKVTKEVLRNAYGTRNAERPRR